jgi:hypothetical protein
VKTVPCWGSCRFFHLLLIYCLFNLRRLVFRASGFLNFAADPIFFDKKKSSLHPSCNWTRLTAEMNITCKILEDDLSDENSEFFCWDELVWKEPQCWIDCGLPSPDESQATKVCSESRKVRNISTASRPGRWCSLYYILTQTLAHMTDNLEIAWAWAFYLGGCPTCYWL